VVSGLGVDLGVDLGIGLGIGSGVEIDGVSTGASIVAVSMNSTSRGSSAGVFTVWSYENPRKALFIFSFVMGMCWVVIIFKGCGGGEADWVFRIDEVIEPITYSVSG